MKIRLWGLDVQSDQLGLLLHIFVDCLAKAFLNIKTKMLKYILSVKQIKWFSRLKLSEHLAQTKWPGLQDNVCERKRENKRERCFFFFFGSACGTVCYNIRRSVINLRTMHQLQMIPAPKKVSVKRYEFFVFKTEKLRNRSLSHILSCGVFFRVFSFSSDFVLIRQMETDNQHERTACHTK